MKKNKIHDIYYEPITFENVYLIWNVVRKTCKNKKAIFRYHIHKNTNNYHLYNVLISRSYKPYPFRLFLIFEPKPRLVMSQTVGDKIINHFVAKFYLLPYLEKKLIDSNVATRKGRGSKYAEKLLSDYINKIRIKHPNREIYALKIDISKYFYNISHELLLQMLSRDIRDKNVLNIIKIIIDETDKPYINETIEKLNKKYNTTIPYYKTGTGLSIGAMTSQFLAIYFLNDLDHFIKEQLRCKYYIRYMDDFIILDINKEKLIKIWNILKQKVSDLRLSINPKSNITKLSIGICFLGYKYKIENEKFIVSYRKKTIKKISRKLQKLRQYDLLKYYKSYGSYYGYLKKIKNWERNFAMKAIQKYDYFKKMHPNKVIFIKEGSFYKTYKDDAVIIWDLFEYKWNKESVAFGCSTGSKVYDKLRQQEIGYVTVSTDDDPLVVKGNDEIYNLYLKLSKIHYEKYNKKQELKENLYVLLDQDIHNYEKIKDYFNQLKKEDENHE